MIIGFIGSGNMAGAMARGWASGADGSPGRMLFTDAGSGRARQLAEETGGEALADNGELVDASDAVVLAVGPSQMQAVADSVPHPEVLLSLLGATHLESLREAFPESGILRLMPNLGVEINQGVICVAEGGLEDRALRDRLYRALGVLGTVFELDDALMDAATAVMGCSPAYFAQVAGALAEAGVEEGLSPDDALRMVGESMAGTAALLARRTPFEISTAVAHPGGSTEAGLDALEDHGAREAFRSAAQASLSRMRRG